MIFGEILTGFGAVQAQNRLKSDPNPPQVSSPNLTATGLAALLLVAMRESENKYSSGKVEIQSFLEHPKFSKSVQ